MATGPQSMYKINLFNENQEPKILCLGAHSDDIEIGCGGTILKLVEEYPKAQFNWVVFSAESNRAEEARKSAQLFLGNIECKVIDIQAFKDSYFPYDGADIKNYFAKIKSHFNPDLIFTHYTQDKHQDHRLIGKLTWQAFRCNLILEYEIAKYDADLAIPNFYIHLDERKVEQKITNICKTFKSQSDKEWFGEETFKALMRIRGLESNSPSKYSEAFHCQKIVM
jgi:LmbE family N-acetylglucosaminyl deacetylase